MMLRRGVLRLGQLTPKTNVRSCSSKITWSTGEKTDPRPLDCPMGNRGEYPRKLPDGGIEYFGFKYYPRFPDQEDPPINPSPVHLVMSVKKLYGLPYWEKEIMKRFRLEKLNSVAVVKNNPENNAHLWKVKHLVKIIPIKFPEGLPEFADPRHCFLKETGEFVYDPHITVNESDYVEDEEITRTKMCKKFIDDHTRKNWEHPWQIKLC